MINLSFNQMNNIGMRYVLDKLSCSTPYGEEKIRKIKVYSPVERQALIAELENVSKTIEFLPIMKESFDKVEHSFMCMKDIRRSIAKCQEVVLDEVELFELKKFLLQLEILKPAFDDINERASYNSIHIDNCVEALDIIDPECNRNATFYVSDINNKRLKEVRNEKKFIENRLRTETDESVKKELHDIRTKLAIEQDEEEKIVRKQMSQALAEYREKLEEIIESVGKLDLTIAKARIAMEYGAVMPEIADDGNCEFVECVNILVSDSLKKRSRSFTPVSIELVNGTTVITGANMGGKSVALKTIALNTMLVHVGMFPFAKRVKVKLLDSMHIISEDLENVDRGLSSFGAEIVQLKEVLSDYENSMILLDEFARGTNPEEGALIVRAAVMYLNQANAYTLMTTHYDNVAEYSKAHYQVWGLKDIDFNKVRQEINAGLDGVEAIEKSMNYGLYKTDAKHSCPHDALNICRLLGLDENIMKIMEKLY